MRLMIILVFSGLIGLGFIRTMGRVLRLRKQTEFVEEFLAKLHQYITSLGADEDAYLWMTRQTPKMQNSLGPSGFGDLKPPFAHYIVKGIPVIPNLLPQIRTCFAHGISRLTNDYGNAVEEVLLRHSGEIEEGLVTAQRSLVNPIIWLREGIQTVLMLPFDLLQWAGLGSTSFVNRVGGSYLVRLISGLFTVVSAVSAIVSLIVGWEEFIKIFVGWIH